SDPLCDGMLKTSELGPEALTVISRPGVVSVPGKMPDGSPYCPAMSAGSSKPTHLITPGAAQRASKSPVGGSPPEPTEPLEAAEPAPHPPTPVAPTAAALPAPTEAAPLAPTPELPEDATSALDESGSLHAVTAMPTSPSADRIGIREPADARCMLSLLSRL